MKKKQPKDSSSVRVPERLLARRTLFCALLTTFLALLVWVVFLNATRITDYLDSDMVNEMTYMQRIWETKSIFPAHWDFANEVHSNRMIFLYVPIYAVTHNFILSHQLTIILGLGMQLLCMLYFLKQLHLDRLAILFVLCCYLGLNVQQKFLFMGGGAYAGFIIAALLTWGLYESLTPHRPNPSTRELTHFPIWHTNAKIIALGIISFYMGFGSPKMALVLYAPWLCAEVIIHLKMMICKRQGECNKKPLGIIVAATLLMINALAYVVSLQMQLNFIPEPTNVATLGTQLSWNNFATHIEALLNSMMIQINYPIPLLSKMGVQYALAFVFVLLTFWATVYIIAFSTDERCKTIGIYFLLETVAVFLYLFITGYPVKVPRYFFITTIMMFVVWGIAFNLSLTRKAWWGEWMTVTMLLMIFVTHSIDPYRGATKNLDLQQVAQYMEENRYSIVTASYWNAGILKGYSNGYIQPRHCYDVVNFVPFRWLTDESLYTEELYSDKTNILLITDVEEEKMYKEKNLQSVLSDGEKVKEYGQYNLYKYTGNLLVIENPVL